MMIPSLLQKLHLSILWISLKIFFMVGFGRIKLLRIVPTPVNTVNVFATSPAQQ
jgi:hypothetical protein